MSSSEDDMLHRCNMRTCLMRVSRKECNMNVPSHPRVEWSWLEIGSENWIHRKSVFWVFRWQSIWVRFSAITQVPELFGEMTNYKTKRPKSTVRKTSCNLSCSLSFLQNILGHFSKITWVIAENLTQIDWHLKIQNTKRPKSTVRKTSCNSSCSLSFHQNIPELGLSQRISYKSTNRLTSEDTEYKMTQVNCAENACFVSPSKCCKPSPLHPWCRCAYGVATVSSID